MTEPISYRQAEEQNQLLDRNMVSDVALGRYLVDTLKDSVRYIIDEDRWLVWDDHYWIRDNIKRQRMLNIVEFIVGIKRVEIAGDPDRGIPPGMDNDDGQRDRALRTLEQYEGIRKMTGVLDAAARDTRIWVESEHLDALGDEIICKNGVVNLTTGKRRDHKREDLSTQIVDFNFTPEVESRMLKEYLDRFMPDPLDQRYLFAVLGDGLRIGNEARRLVIVWGGTTSGKSQLFNALARLLGPYITSTEPSVFKTQKGGSPRPELAKIIDKRIVYAPEASRSWGLDGDQIKRMTGDTALSFRQIFKAHEEKDKAPRFTPFIVTNEIPRFSGVDAGLRRRITAIHFDQSLALEEEDTTIRARFVADDSVMEGLLARLIAGAGDTWIMENVPDRFMVATADARASLDHIGEFIKWLVQDDIIVDTKPNEKDSACCTLPEMLDAYKFWIKNYAEVQDRREALGRNTLNAALEDHGWIKNKSGAWVWTGIKWNPAMDSATYFKLFGWKRSTTDV